MQSVWLISVWLASSFVAIESEMTYTPWSLENMTGMYCPDSCAQDKECCLCENKREWQLQSQVANLHIRYTDIRGSSIVYIHRDDMDYNHTRLSYVNGRLREIPTNICDFPTIVELILDNNEIESIDRISCLSDLDSLSLNYNNLEIIRNTTFENSTSLRNLYMNNNKIVNIEPNSFKLCCGQYILNIDVSNNQLESIDVTNCVIKSFCKISYSNNRNIIKVTNQLDFKTMPEDVFGSGGLLSFENCSFRSFFNYSDFGLNSWSQLYKNLDMSLSVTSDQLTCDCNIAELFSGGASIASIKKFWTQFEVYVCERPTELNGSKLTDIFQTYPEKQDLLTCNITDSCPKKCRCYNQPSQSRVVVDCQGQNLTTLPKHLPWGNGDRLQLLLGGNDIKRIEDRPYLSRVAELDLSGNPLSYISESAAFVLPRDARLSIIGNKLTSLPRHFQNRNPSTLFLGRVFILCSCEDLWLKSWLSYHRYEDSNTSYICQNLGESEITVTDFSELHCFPDTSNLNIILGSLTGVLVVIIAVIVCRMFCYPEIYVLYRRKLRGVKKSHGFKYDAYISFYDEDRLQRKWVMEILAIHLERRGYSVFIPIRDSDLAETREGYLRSKIQRSENFIIILSEKYFKSTKERQEDDGVEAQRACSEFEFDIIWKVYTADMRRNLIIINFDNLSASEIGNRWVKACCRVGEIEDFTERQGLLLDIVERKIYPPRSKFANCNKEQGRVNSITVRDLDS